MWPENELMRIQREEAHRLARERRLATALRRGRRAARRARRREMMPAGRAEHGQAVTATADAGPIRPGAIRWPWSVFTKARDINIGKV
jgi:hypothetical protein